MRTIVYRFGDLAGFESALVAGDQELALPSGETIAEAEWVLAMFEVGDRKRATAAAGRGVDCGDGTMVLVFERRDWERLLAFASTNRESLDPLAGSLRDSGSSTASAARSYPSVQSPSHPAGGARGRDGRDGSRPADEGSTRPSGTSRLSGRFASSATKARVLVVDDDPDIRDVVGAMLESVGLVVEAVESAEAALERVSTQMFDLLVLDWNLPGMTGIDLCRHFRREPQFATLPVLFLTVHASSKDVVEAFASGADDYVVKPFRAPELGARIFGLLRRARVMQAL